MSFDKPRIAIVAAGFGAFLNLYPPQPLLPQLEAAFGLAPGGAAVTVSAGTLAVALLAPFAGVVTDLAGRARVMTISIVGLGLATILSGTAQTLSEMLAWRFACGLFIPGIVAAAVGALGEDPDPRHAARAAGQYISGTVLGGFSGRFLAGLITDLAGWRTAFYCIGVLTLFLLPVILPGMKQAAAHPHATVGSTLQAAAGHLRNRRLLALFAIGFGLLFALVGTFTYAALLLAAPPYDFSPAALGSIFAVYLVGVAVTPFTGKWIGRHGRGALATAAMMFAMAGIAITLVPSAAVIVIGLAVSSGGIFMLQALATGFVPTAADGAKAAAVGLYTSAYYFGGSIGAVAPALLWRAFGWNGVVPLLAAVHLALLVLARRLWRESEHHGGRSGCG